jgi:hypothetical protein
MQIIRDKDTMVIYLCATPQGPIPFDSEALNSFLPFTRSEAGSGSRSGITYGSYLDAVQAFLDRHHKEFWGVVYRRLGTTRELVSSVDIIAEKHGSDYHPARVSVRSGEAGCSFVVNVALSERGKQRLVEDFANLRKLDEIFQPGFIPEAYFRDEQAVLNCDGEGVVSVMFMGEWLEGFHEFHLTPSDNESSQIILWDSYSGYVRLSAKQAHDIYRQAAFILTWYYNPETCQEIFPWHHASGDFVARIDGNTVEVKLITVRQYASRAASRDLSRVDRLNHLFLFFANLTVRMRLDRFDGIGDMAWAGSGNVNACIEGFLDALTQKITQNLCDRQLIGEFLGEARRISPGDLANIFQIVLESYNEDAPDFPLIKNNFQDHILQTYLALREIPE